MAGKHWTNLELLLKETNANLRNFITDMGRNILQTARIRNPAKTSVDVDGSHRGGLKFESKARGGAASMLGFDYSFQVPIGGFTPRAGKKAFLMKKPEGWVFRSRTYTRFSGQTIRRTGFFSDALREEVLSIKGKRRQQFMNDKLAAQFARAVADNIESRYYSISGLGFAA